MSDDREIGGWRRGRLRPNQAEWDPLVPSAVRRTAFGRAGDGAWPAGATPTTDFLWRMSSGLSRRASELLSGDVGQMMFLTIGNAVPPHDEDDLEPLSAQRAQRLTMAMPARALLIVIGARPVAAL